MSSSDIVPVLSDLARFLRNPVIKLEPSDRVRELQDQIDELRLEKDKLQLQYDRLLSVYQDEMNRVFVLQDLCRENGLKVR